MVLFILLYYSERILNNSWGKGKNYLEQFYEERFKDIYFILNET